MITVLLLFLIGVIATDLPMAQEQTKEMPLKGRQSFSKQKSPEVSLQRNPFSLPSGIYLLSKEGSASAPKQGAKPVVKFAEIDPFRVKAILISDHIRLACIGQTIVTIGDWVGDERVLEITPDRVILGKGDRKRTLLLYQSPVKLTVEEKAKGENP